MFAAIIYDSMNVITRVEERPTKERAIRAGAFYRRLGGWFRVTDDQEDIELSKVLINA